jgi:hypothetical protein
LDVDACVITLASQVRGKRCLLVQATTDRTGDTSTVSTINVDESRRWLPLLCCSVIPIFLAILIRVCSNLYHEKMEKNAFPPTASGSPQPPSPPRDTADIFAAAIESDGLLNFSTPPPQGDYRAIPVDNCSSDAVAKPVPRYTDLQQGNGTAPL